MKCCVCSKDKSDDEFRKMDCSEIGCQKKLCIDCSDQKINEKLRREHPKHYWITLFYCQDHANRETFEAIDKKINDSIPPERRLWKVPSWE